MTRLTVVVPAYNEADRLPPTLAQIVRHLESSSRWRPAEVLVVDDGSVDGTAEVTGAVERSAHVRLRTLSHPQNLGKGAAVRTGFRHSAGDQILLSDADLSSPIDQLEVLAAGGPDDAIRIGSRAVDRTLIAVRQPSYRDLMGRVFNLGVRALLLPGILDTQCGFKLFPGDLGRSLAAVQRIDGFAFDVELLYLARLWGAAVVEVPVRWSHVEASRVSPVRHSSQMLRDLLALRLRGLVGRLPAPPNRGRAGAPGP
jgi:dolichyl-phosphate beta-glucosyltransferase